ncbi:RNA polymerase sigma factor [Streptomyces sp. MB22_4]|uniref:RNA polymerase sigma factor n=1 Tax=Streptomyces sp. MB22_4 TaxID=3383120 RepID=UPI0039A37A96
MLRGGARRDGGGTARPSDGAHGADGAHGGRAAHARGGTGDDPLDAAQERRVRAVLALGGVPQSDLADGVQQVRLRLLERTASGQEAPRDVSAWAAVVASRLAMDWHRARRRQERLGERLAAQRAPACALGEESSVLSLAMARGLEELPAAQRQVLVLRFYADLPVRDIAEALGIPEGTVKSRLHTAVRALRARLHEDGVV